MRELVRTNDPVVLSFVEALLKEQDIGHMVVDTNMSVLEGSIGILPARLMVADRDEFMARANLRDAGLDD